MSVVTPTRGTAVVAVGTAITLIASAIGFARAMTMPASMPDMTGDFPMSRLHGMPLSEMPEMFVAAVGILLVLSAAPWHPARRPVAADALSRRRTGLVAVVATAALTIDISKTSTLGFVIPGMREEYGISPGTASLLAVAGLTGTATGALLFGRLADRYGRRRCYLIATLGFTATSMCGCMPTFAGNVVMCLLMGVAVGGLAPLLVTLLADVFGTRVRGPAVVALSVVATAIGYLVAAGSALWLEPVFGWRILWLIGAPTGLVLVAVTFLVPERAPGSAPAAPEVRTTVARSTLSTGLQRVYAALTGILTFGLTTWVPTLSRADGLPAGTANALLTAAALAMVPCAVLLAWCYRRFGPVPICLGLAVLTAAMLFALTFSGVADSAAWVSAGALVAALFAVNTMAAVFLPVAADLAESGRRAGVAGNISFCNRLGGLAGPLVLAALVASVSDVLVAVAVLALCSGLLSWYIGRRHRTATAGKSAALPEKAPL
ncbi:MFS transporter [Saccharopolyspora shandongensis]|uniref:MFS transporter n=1 Tax=Saccharopolyspora shandongensis TaxID=418495 RepID=UPI0033F1B38F